MMQGRHPTVTHVAKYSVLAAVASALVTAMCGCTIVRDAVAWATGAPSTDQIEAQAQKIRDAEQMVDALELQVDHAERAAQTAQSQARQAEQRKAEMRALYAEMAGQLGALEGAAADSLLASLDELRRRIQLAERERSGSLEIAAEYQARIERIKTDQAGAMQSLERAQDMLDGYLAQTEAAISSTLAGVQAVGHGAADLGLPAARQVTDTVTGTLRTGLEVILLGGAAGGTLMARRRRQQRDTEQQRRLNLTRIVQANDQLGLVKDDEELREAAKRIAGPSAVRELKLARATEVLPAEAPAAQAA